MDYRKDQLGAIDPLKDKNSDRAKSCKPLAQQQCEPGPLKGALLIEGDFYCPGMPNPFVDAQALFRRPKKDPKRIDSATRDERIDVRAEYLLTRKEKLDADGRIRHACPATTAGGKLKCPLRREYVFADNADRTEVENPPTHPPEICDTKRRSVAIQLDDRTAKHVQDQRYRSREWYRRWKERNRAESFNASLKQKDHENLNDGARRPVAGFAKQALLAAVLVFTANLRTLREFMQKHGKQIPAAPPEPDPCAPKPGTDRPTIFTEERPPPDRLAA